MRNQKPILNTNEQIAHLQSKGVKFNLISVDEAKKYLELNNNYFKLRAYRKNFPKHPGGKLQGQYINLDFAMLKDLAIIDMHLRYLLLQMSLDIEHFAKVRLLKAIENNNNDGYSIVIDYIDSLSPQRKRILQEELARNQNNPYCGGIISKYNGCYPIWAFIEIITFGTLIHLYDFCITKLCLKKMKSDYYLLSTIRELRNAAAHNNCFIYDMSANDAQHKPDPKMLMALKNIPTTTKQKRFKNERTRQIITLLYTHKTFVSSHGVFSARKEALNKLIKRIFHHIDYYADNKMIISNFNFLKNVVDILYP